MTDTKAPAQDAPGMMRGVARHTVIYAIGIMARPAASFLLLPVYTRYLSPEDYGVLALVELTIDFIQMFTGVQLLVGIARFFHDADEQREKHLVVSTAFLGILVGYGLLGLGTFAGADAIGASLFDGTNRADLIRIAALTMAIQPFTTVPLLFAQVTDKSTLFVTAGLARLVLQICFNLFFLIGLGMGPEGVLWGALITDALVGSALVAWLVRSVGVRFSGRVFRKLAKFGLPMIGVSLSGFVYTFADRFFLYGVADEGTVGLYQLAYKFGFLLVMIGLAPFMSVWGPKRFSLEKHEDRHTLLSDGFKYANVLLITVGVGIAVYSKDVIRIMSDPEFHAAAAVIPVILVAYIFHGWAIIQDIGVLIRERTTRLAFAHLLAALVALVGYWLLIPPLLAWGAAIATVLSFAVRWAAIYLMAQQSWRVNYQWQPILKLLAMGLVTFGLATAFSPEGIVGSLAFRTALVVGYFVAVWHSGVVGQAEKELVITIVRQPSRVFELFGKTAG